jgi:hypothetical protein
MFCANCGSNISDDVTFCPNCGKSPKAVEVFDSTASPAGANQTSVYVQNFNSSVGYIKPKHNFPLLNLTARLFSLFFEISLWILLVLGVIIGGVIGGYTGGSLAAIGGILVGSIVSFVIMVVSGGLVSIFVRINDNIEELKQKIK